MNQAAPSEEPAEVTRIENKIRSHVFAMRVRLSDVFSDFDRLRSKHVTASYSRIY
jgi:hypothetical protein